MIQFYGCKNKELFIVFLSAVEGLEYFRYSLQSYCFKEKTIGFPAIGARDFKFPTFLSFRRRRNLS
jgi:hypothetical protein